MNKGFGICGHKNSYSKGVKVGNFVEDEMGSKLAQSLISKPFNAKSESQEKFQNPSNYLADNNEKDKDNNNININELDTSLSRSGLSYQMIFAHGPGIVVDPNANNDTRWITTNQLLHGKNPIKSSSVLSKSKSSSTIINYPLPFKSKARELLKRNAREKRELKQYHTTNNLNSNLIH